MVETMILATLVGFVGGILSSIFIEALKPKHISTKRHTIEYFKGMHSDFVIVKDKFGNKIADISLKKNANGVDSITYAQI